MSTISVAIRIWAKTVFLNAFLFGMWALFTGDIFEMLGAGLVLIGGFIITLPLLILVVPLVTVSNWLPYGIPARTTWLTFFLGLLILALYAVVSLFMDDALFKTGSVVNRLLGTTIAGLLVAVLTTRKSLSKLYTQS